jgi:hypothetical protein
VEFPQVVEPARVHLGLAPGDGRHLEADDRGAPDLTPLPAMSSLALPDEASARPLPTRHFDRHRRVPLLSWTNETVADRIRLVSIGEHHGPDRIGCLTRITRQRSCSACWGNTAQRKLTMRRTFAAHHAKGYLDENATHNRR